MAPKSPLSIFRDAIANASTLKPVPSIRVLLGAKELPPTGAPPRIVVFPSQGKFDAAADSSISLVDGILTVAAEIWGADIDAAWDLRNRVIQALEEQGAAGGLFWDVVAELWSPNGDTSVDGQELRLLFSLRMAVPSVDQDVGHVGDNWSKGEITQITFAGRFLLAVYTMADEAFEFTVAHDGDQDFTVTLPTPQSDANYAPAYSLEDVAGDVVLSFPDSSPGDRTATQFRVLASAPMSAGDTILFTVARL